MAKPKASFRTRFGEGDYLSVSIFPTKKDPESEVIAVQIRRPAQDNWETIARIAIYRSAEGNYSELPDRGPP